MNGFYSESFACSSQSLGQLSWQSLIQDRCSNYSQRDHQRISTLTFLLSQRVIPTFDIKKFQKAEIEFLCPRSTLMG